MSSGLEEFHRVARRVVEHDLLATWAAHDVAPKLDPDVSQPRGLRVDVIDPLNWSVR